MAGLFTMMAIIASMIRSKDMQHVQVQVHPSDKEDLNAFFHSNNL